MRRTAPKSCNRARVREHVQSVRHAAASLAEMNCQRDPSERQQQVHSLLQKAIAEFMQECSQTVDCEDPAYDEDEIMNTVRRLLR